jgi:hypothetical protein
MVMMMGWINDFGSFLYHIIPFEDVTYWKYTYYIGYAIDSIRALERSVYFLLSRGMKTLVWKRLDEGEEKFQMRLA